VGFPKQGLTMSDLRFALWQLVRNSGFTVPPPQRQPSDRVRFPHCFPRKPGHSWQYSYGRLALAVFTLALGVRGNTAVQGAESSRTSEWITGSPEEVGLDSAALSEMFDYVREHNVPVHSVQIVRHGRLVLDAYIYPYSSEMRHDVASVTKSVTSTLVGLAIQKGFLRDVQQPVLSFFPTRPAANSEANKQKLTLEHLLTMQAGWDCGFEAKEARLFEMRRSADWLQFMLDLPMVAEPGTRFAYCSGNPHVLSMILSQVTGTNGLAFARQELFEPLGIRDVAWPADPRGNNHGWGDLQMHPRDMARLGQLFLQRGRWDKRQILSEAWVRTATHAHVKRTTNRDHYGYSWWVKGEDYPGMFEAVGRGGQRINVWPAKDLVLVFTGGEFEPGDLAKFLLRALRSDAPLQPNPQTSAQLQERIASAVKPSPSQPVGKLPAIAASISGKKFKLSTNTLGVSSLVLNFNDSAEAQAELLWNGRRVPFRVGLDAVERFSTNALVGLPQAAKGQWVNHETLLLQLDLIGAINCYRFKLTFSEAGKSLTASVAERTGLNDEQFEGVLSP
jgi:CubicO group peptidase (beta-lactamase class C family)